MLEQDAVELVQDGSSPGFYNHIFVTPKKEADHWRPITNLSHLNSFLLNYPFKMETAISIQTALEPDQWATSIDLKCAYLQVPVHPRSRKYLRFTHDDQVYQHKTLVFGLASSPRLFTEFTLILAGHLRKRGIRFHAYLDDWLIRGRDEHTVQTHTQEVISTCHRLGMVINWDKSSLTPKQDFQFVGIRFDLRRGLALPPLERVHKLQKLLALLKRQRTLPAYLWQSLTGIMASMMRQTPLGRLNIRPFQWHLSDHWTASTDHSLQQVQLDDNLLPHIAWWSNTKNTQKGTQLRPFCPTLRLYTDASDKGWGAHLESQSTGIQGTWEPPRPGQRDKLEGAESSPTSSSTLLPPDEIREGTTGHGQHHGSGVHQQPGGDQIRIPHEPDLGPVPMVPEPGRSTQSPTHSGTAQRIGGPTEQEHTGDFNRMVTTALSDGANLVEVGETMGGPVCHQVQQQATELRLSSPGRQSMAGGRSVPRLDGPVGLCLPPGATDTNHPPEDEPRTLHPDSHSTPETRETLVPSPTGPTNRPTVATSHKPRPAPTTKDRPLPPGSRQPQPSRLEVIEQASRAQGFSASVAHKAASARRASTLRVYDAKWQTFATWCTELRIDPTCASTQQVADFLDHLFTGPKQLAASTIAGYRASVSKVLLKTTGIDIGQDSTIGDLMNHFKRVRPKATNSIPQWDLTLVLRTLKKAPFEPLSSADLKYVTWKTAFLLLLAMGGRRGEVHALEASTIKVLGNWDSVILNPNPAFLPKNADLSSNKRNLRDIHLESLADLTGKDYDLDYDLCPVRALRTYLGRTEKSRDGIKPLFLTYKSGPSRAASANTLSGWVKQLLKRAYENAAGDTNLLRLQRASVHEVRAIAASLALYKNVPMEDILNNCRWSSTTTFSSHYLRDMTDTTQKLHGLLPLSVAGTTIQKKNKKHRK